MKIVFWILIFCPFLELNNAIKSNIYAPFNVITLKDITPDERRQIALMQQKLERGKRSGGSGSSEIISLLASSIGNGIKKKIGQLTSASAAASGTFSKTSSSGGYGKEYYHHTEYDHHHHPQPSVDSWDFKKSVLNTLLQAVKAIKGGVVAVKGQLIKGGGKLISASGNLVSYAGEAITSHGKTIATNAILVPYHASKGTQHTHTDYGEHVPHSHYSGPSGSSEDIYHQGPSGASLDYQVPDNYPPPHREGAAGLLILKKVSPSYHTPSQYARQSYSPSTGTMISKLFAASSSFDPNEPKLFGEERQPSNTIDSYQAYLATPMSSQKEVVASASGAVSQETRPSADISQNQVDPGKINGFLSSFEDSPNYINENFDNLSASPSIKQTNILPDENSLKVTNAKNVAYSINSNLSKQPLANSFEYESKEPLNTFDYNSKTPPSNSFKYDLKNPGFYPDYSGFDTANHFPDQSEQLSDPLTSNRLNYKKSISPESLKLTLSPYLETPKMDYSIPSPNEEPKGLKSNRRPSLESFLKHKSPRGTDFDLVQSITYEIGPNGPKRVT